ncbi:hypothetical protein CDAR_194301 [Caerostris darwini]|uniref:Integrase catalytic domain-containing protein n=1 Tax=Caerostris darwini TaxID=1538125 RepID=A0AAV4S9X4_9ARAC|nr:hypothetical protein CDAR_194301 [Caerostris darwini]
MIDLDNNSKTSKYLANVEWETNCDLMRKRTVNRSEFDDFLSRLGFKHECSSNYNDQPNDFAEKFIRTAMDGVRDMLQNFFKICFNAYNYVFGQKTSLHLVTLVIGGSMN